MNWNQAALYISISAYVSTEGETEDKSRSMLRCFGFWKISKALIVVGVLVLGPLSSISTLIFHWLQRWEAMQRIIFTWEVNLGSTVQRHGCRPSCRLWFLCFVRQGYLPLPSMEARSFGSLLRFLCCTFQNPDLTKMRKKQSKVQQLTFPKTSRSIHKVPGGAGARSIRLRRWRVGVLAVFVSWEDLKDSGYLILKCAGRSGPLTPDRPVGQNCTW